MAAEQALPDDVSQVRQNIILVYQSMPEDIKRSAYRSPVSFGEVLRAIAGELDLDLNLIRREWPKWIKLQGSDTHGLYPFAMVQIQDSSRALSDQVAGCNTSASSGV